MHNLTHNGVRQVPKYKPDSDTINKWRGTASLDMDAVTNPLMLVPVQLDLSRELDRQVALKLQEKVQKESRDAWLFCRHAGKHLAFSRAPEYKLPQSGVLTFTYALCVVHPLPDPLDGHYEFDLRLPWEWWRASALLDLSFDGHGEWQDPTLDKVAIDSSNLPKNLPHSGLLNFTFATIHDLGHAQPQRELVITLDLSRRSHTTIANEFNKLPRGPQASGDCTFRMFDQGRTSASSASPHKPIPLPTSGRLGVCFTPPLHVHPHEPKPLSIASFEALLHEWSALVEEEQGDFVKAASKTRPLNSSQALALLAAKRAEVAHGDPLTCVPQLGGLLEASTAEQIALLAPLVAPSQRGLFLVNALRSFYNKEPLTIELPPSALTEVAKAALNKPKRTRRHAVGYFHAAAPGGGAKRVAAATRAAGASKMPLPPRPPRMPNTGPRKPQNRFLVRRPNGDFSTYTSAMESTRPNYVKEESIFIIGGESVVAG